MNGQIVRVCLQVHENMSALVARITRTSAELLALKEGMAVLAMCKATAVRVFGEVDAADLSVLVGFAPSLMHIRSGMQIHASVDESAVVVALLP